MKESLHIRMPLVILPVDDFTGETILRPDVTVRVKGAAYPVQKADGFRVFTKLPDGQAEVSLQGPGYQKTNIVIITETLDHKNPLVRIRIKPDRSYRFPAGTAYMEGTLPPQSILLVSGMEGPGFCKVMSDCKEGGERIAVFQSGEKNLEGMVYYMTNTKGTVHDWIELASVIDTQKGIYQLKAPFSQSIKKAEVRLYPAVKQDSGAIQTPYFIAVYGRNQGKNVTAVCCLQQGTTLTESKLVLEAEKTLHQDF